MGVFMKAFLVGAILGAASAVAAPLALSKDDAVTLAAMAR